MATNNTNEKSVASTVIAAVMRDEAANNSRSLELTAYMFDSEATFSKPAIAGVMRLKGEEKTAAIDNLISDLSPEFFASVRHLAKLKDDRKEAKDNEKIDIVNRIELVSKQLRAARKMFDLCMIAVYGLRHDNALELKIDRKAVLSVKYLVREHVGKDGAKERETATFKRTIASLVSGGNKALETDKVKAAKIGATQANNPAANVLADASKALAASLTKFSADGKRMVVADADGEVGKNINVVLRELFVANFFDGDTFDKPTFEAWLAETVKFEKEAQAAIKRGKAKVAADIKESGDQVKSSKVA